MQTILRCIYEERACNNVTAIVLMDCGKKRDRGGGLGGDDVSGRLNGGPEGRD